MVRYHATPQGNVQFTEEEELAIVRRANYYGISKTSYIKMVVMQHARSKIEELATFK